MPRALETPALNTEPASKHETTTVINDPLWFKDAIIYEVHVRSFYDSVDDGMGDFPGLTKKLDYIQDLGVTAIWVLPFCPSPWKDDGYDVSDYENIDPVYGTLKDFDELEREAKKKGIFQGAEPLRPTITATTVRLEGGKPLILDGPFAETKEQLAGYYILDCDNLDEAISWAAKIPTSCRGGEGCIEIRPIADLPYLRAMARALA